MEEMNFEQSLYTAQDGWIESRQKVSQCLTDLRKADLSPEALIIFDALVRAIGDERKYEEKLSEFLARILAAK